MSNMADTIFPSWHRKAGMVILPEGGSKWAHVIWDELKSMPALDRSMKEEAQ
jgi:hypothetical protein